MERAVGMGEKKEAVRVRMGHGLKRLGYEALDNPHTKDGRWKVNGVWCKVYKKRGFTVERAWQAHLEIPPGTNRTSTEDKSHGK